jgi:hypothetical protein
LPRPRKPGLTLSLWRRKSLGQEPRWNADRCAPQQMVCADLRKLVCGEARPCPMARQITHCVCRRFASESYFFVLPVLSLASLPDLIRQSMPKRRLRMLPPAFVCCSSAWTTGSSPVVTSKRQWLAIARMLRRIARTEWLAPKRFPDAVQRETVHRRSGIVSNAEFAKVPVQQRTISCCAAPGMRYPRTWPTPARSGRD